MLLLLLLLLLLELAISLYRPFISLCSIVCLFTIWRKNKRNYCFCFVSSEYFWFFFFFQHHKEYVSFEQIMKLKGKRCQFCFGMKGSSLYIAATFYGPFSFTDSKACLCDPGIFSSPPPSFFLV